MVGCPPLSHEGPRSLGVTGPRSWGHEETELGRKRPGGEWAVVGTSEDGPRAGRRRQQQKLRERA